MINIFKRKQKKLKEEYLLPTVPIMLHTIMAKKHIDQQRLAKLLNVDKSQITRWMNGQKPKTETGQKILNLYDEVKNEV